MKPASAVFLLVASATLAGCLGSANPALLPAPTGSPAASVEAGAAEAAAAGGASPGDPAQADAPVDPRLGARALPVTGVYEDYPTGAGASLCTNPPACHAYLAFGINFTGTLTGEAIGVAHDSPPDPAHPDRLTFEKNPVSFTGSIEGCGSGSLGFVIHGYFQPTPEGMRTNETLQYVPGSASTGFANVVDAFLSFDADPYAWPGPVQLTGTVWCR